MRQGNIDSIWHGIGFCFRNIMILWWKRRYCQSWDNMILIWFVYKHVLLHVTPFHWVNVFMRDKKRDSFDSYETELHQKSKMCLTNHVVTIGGALNDLFGWMFILVAVLPCLQLFQNRTEFFFQTIILLYDYVCKYINRCNCI